MPYGWTSDQIKDAIDRHTKELARLIEDRAPAEKVMKLRASMDSLYKYYDKAKEKEHDGDQGGSDAEQRG